MNIPNQKLLLCTTTALWACNEPIIGEWNLQTQCILSSGECDSFPFTREDKTYDGILIVKEDLECRLDAILYYEGEPDPILVNRIYGTVNKENHQTYHITTPGNAADMICTLTLPELGCSSPYATYVLHKAAP